ncbi:MAG: 3-dehydroquinate dehydratase [Candidatus Dormibacteraeota bacterium]|jgi:3-dehydroquinate dehydratase II|nr:3-dehydroquinate dehydratase [Candidatus Dormibacteraeota bacterium]
MKKLLVVAGPNLNLLGSREPDIYGRTTLAEIEAMVKERVSAAGHAALCFQSNSEGAILDFLQQEAPTASGIVLNPGALTHYSYALYDCLRALQTPVVEVHLSNLYARGETEHFRSRNVTAPAAVGVITGLGPKGYLLAVDYLLDRDG